MALPLAGVKVLDLTRALAGPFCTMILADLGAEVIKVEPTGGEMIRGWGPFKDGISVYYLSVHRNKRSLVVNFRDPAGLELLREMIRDVDVVVENYKPGVMDAMGMSWDAIHKINPRAILCSVTGMGRGGPYEDWPGMDQIAQGMSGLMSLTGHAQTGPVRVGIPIGDVVGGMWAALGVQAALFQRNVTGVGQLVETSLLGGLIGLLNVQGQRQLTLDDTPGVAGNAKLCELIGMPELITDPRFTTNALRMKNREALKPILNAKFVTRGKMEWTLDLVKLGLPAGPIFNLKQAFEDPHISKAGMIEEIDHPTLGKLRVLANPIRMEAMEGKSVRTPPPLLGQHSREVLREFGLAEARIDALVGKGVVSEA